MNNQPTDGSMHPRALALAGIGALAALAVPSVFALFVDGRMLLGVSVWNKPLKFDLSLSVHLLTFYLLLGCIASPLPPKAQKTLRLVVLSAVVIVIAEALYITLQAARGRASHYNRDTALESFLYYGVMGPGAVLLLVSAFGFGWLLWRHGKPSSPAGLRWGGALGLMLGSVVTMATVVPLSAGFVDGLGHWVGGVRSDVAGLPVTGWSTTGGDLRVPHFFATHMMQALPLAGWLGDWLGRHPRRWVNAAAVIGVAVVAGTSWQAISGKPLIVF